MSAGAVARRRRSPGAEWSDTYPNTPRAPSGHVRIYWVQALPRPSRERHQVGRTPVGYWPQTANSKPQTANPECIQLVCLFYGFLSINSCMTSVFAVFACVNWAFLGLVDVV